MGGKGLVGVGCGRGRGKGLVGVGVGVGVGRDGGYLLAQTAIPTSSHYPCHQ
jgi:hypothetical protein